MSLARALTKRYKNLENAVVPSLPSRATSTKKWGTSFDRAQISLPIELLSTTNVLAYNAPDLHPIDSSASSSTGSYDDSDSSPALSSSSSISTPDISRESSPALVEPNHLSTYFEMPNRGRSTDSVQSDPDVPAVPSRALSHTKKSHQASARHRSQSQIRNSAQSATHATTNSRTSFETFASKPDANHPFGAELAQVNELAEEFGAADVRVWDEEEQFLVENGLQKFGVEDYVLEIQGLFGGIFDDRPFPIGGGWI